MRSASTFRPTALAARSTTTSFQRGGKAGRARAGGQARTALHCTLCGAKVSVCACAHGYLCRTQRLDGRASACEHGEQRTFDGEEHAHSARLRRGRRRQTERDTRP